MKKLFCLSLIMILVLTGCSGTDAKKKEQIQAALDEKNKQKEQLKESVKNDKEAPVITSTIDKYTCEVPDKIAYDKIIYSLSASDNVDGDLSKNIKQKDSDVVEHEEGNYTITYSVLDSAGNEGTYKLRVTISSKYSETEKKSIQYCINAYNKLSDSLKSPESLNPKSIRINEDASLVLIEYSADNSFGASVKGTVIYDTKNRSLYDAEDLDLSKIITYKSYTYDELKEYGDYYSG